MKKSDTVILIGDVREQLRTLPDDSVDCVVTSPPYWGLRDYGVKGQIGLEPTLGEHLEVMVSVFAEVYRVLKPTGTCFVNYGDCYAAHPNGRSAADTKAAGGDDRTFRDKPFSTVGPVYDSSYKPGANRNRARNTERHKSPDAVAPSGRVVAGGYMKPKDLCMVPNRFAIAMQEWGWWVRSEIIWAKPNPMPESVRDRPATAHEKIWMFTKAGKYTYDAGAVRREPSESSVKRWQQDIENQKGSDRAKGGTKSNGSMKAVGGPKKDKQRGHSRRHAGFNDRWDQMTLAEQRANGRHLKNYEPARFEVWEMSTASFKADHFATFPEELARRCIAAGCPMGGTVLDPFGGAGTTALAAKNLGRKATLIELNPEYAELAATRLRQNLCQVEGVDQQPVSDLPLLQAVEAAG